MNGEELFKEHVSQIKNRLVKAIKEKDYDLVGKIAYALSPKLAERYDQPGEEVSQSVKEMGARFEFESLYGILDDKTEEELLNKVDDFVRSGLATIEYDLVDNHIELERQEKEIENALLYDSPEYTGATYERANILIRQYYSCIDRFNTLTGSTYENGIDIINDIGLKEDLENNINKGSYDKTKIERLTSAIHTTNHFEYTLFPSMDGLKL